MRYLISSVYTMSLRSDHNTLSPKIGSLNAGRLASGDEIYNVTEDSYISKVGDKWLHVRDMGGVMVDGWMAIIHLGKEYCTLKDSGVIPPANDGVKRIIDAVITYETESGATMTKRVVPVD